MTSRLIIAVTAAGLALLMVAGSPATEVRANARCTALKQEFTSSARPRFLRIVKRNRDVAAYFRNELRRGQAGETPTRAEIRKAYTKTHGVCRNASCKTAAQAVYSATLQLYTFNRRWKNAGCPGYLSN